MFMMAVTPGLKTKNTNDGISSTRPRHYTEYNLFFQLEREYILQKIFQVKPQVNHADDIFDPTKPSYSGPPLPKRYDDLILKKDWYIPGNKKRRKHKKSHVSPPTDVISKTVPKITPSKFFIPNKGQDIVC